MQRRTQKRRGTAPAVSRSLPGYPGHQQQRLITWESEVRAIAREATAWRVETGGDLFGFWDLTPVIYLATRVGPKAVRNTAHFRLDVDYVRKLSDVLAADWELRYLGDWHSHHRLQLREPSSGDRQRIQRLAARNAFPGMAEIIVTFLEGEVENLSVRLDPWIYLQGGVLPTGSGLMIVPGVSPVREALVARGSLPEQELDRWVDLPASRVPSLEEPRSRDEDAITNGLMKPLSVRLVAQACRVLEHAANGPVERHSSAFGVVLAAPAGPTELVAIAVGESWPCDILEIDWIDRDRRSSEAIDVARPANLLVPDELALLYQAVLKLKHVEGRQGDVDSGPA